ncbi:MAG: thioredoxin-dependent thiol peroxidase [Gemmatimonadaceae bacterium]|nr:thioredoxin-dependent thiol peroxidase [Gemmatimonadaceae bacterium]
MAPGFSLPDDTGATVSLEDFKGKRVVLYFYPRADTPGCTTESCEFRDAFPRFDGVDAVVLGASPDTVVAQAKFRKKYDFPFRLLADADHALAEQYGVWKEKSMYGRRYMGVERTTFVIGPDGRVTHVFAKVKPAGHAEQVLSALA